MSDPLEHRIPASLPYLRIPEYIPQKGLVGFWPFFKRRGTLLDYSGEGFDGTISGATWRWFTEPSKPGLSYDGTDDYVDYPPTDIGEGSSWTVCGWFKTDTGKDNNLAWAETCFGDSPYILIYYADTAQSAIPGVRLTMNDGPGVTHIFDTQNNRADGEWHHVTIVQRATDDREIFVDGSSINTSTTSFPTISVTDGWMGGETGFGQYYNGDEISIWIYDRALSSAEIVNIYNKTKP